MIFVWEPILQGLKTLIKCTKFILVQSWVVAFLNSVLGIKILQNYAFYSCHLQTIYFETKKNIVSVWKALKLVILNMNFALQISSVL